MEQSWPAAWRAGADSDPWHLCCAGVPVVQVDPVFEGSEGGPDSLVKFNPLSDVSSAEVWNFLRVMVRPVLLLMSACHVDTITAEPARQLCTGQSRCLHA